ncbi:hypothetical protein MY3296_000463 [Beauveria thailandica]
MSQAGRAAQRTVQFSHRSRRDFYVLWASYGPAPLVRPCGAGLGGERCADAEEPEKGQLFGVL